MMDLFFNTEIHVTYSNSTKNSWQTQYQLKLDRIYAAMHRIHHYYLIACFRNQRCKTIYESLEKWAESLIFYTVKNLWLPKNCLWLFLLGPEKTNLVFTKLNCCIISLTQNSYTVWGFLTEYYNEKTATRVIIVIEHKNPNQPCVYQMIGRIRIYVLYLDTHSATKLFSFAYL